MDILYTPTPSFCFREGRVNSFPLPRYILWTVQLSDNFGRYNLLRKVKANWNILKEITGLFLKKTSQYSIGNTHGSPLSFYFFFNSSSKQLVSPLPPPCPWLAKTPLLFLSLHYTHLTKLWVPKCSSTWHVKIVFNSLVYNWMPVIS